MEKFLSLSSDVLQDLQSIVIDISVTVRCLSSRSLNLVVAQFKNCPFAVDTTIEFKNVTTISGSNGI
jgi:hypothetical protein